MPQPGDIYLLSADHTSYWKYHLCISVDGAFLYINSPKPKPRAGELQVPNGDLPNLPATPCGNSLICCSLILKKSARAVRGGKYIGRADKALLRKVLAFIEDTDALSAEDKDLALDGLADWV